MKILQVIPAFVPAYGYGGALNVCHQQSIKLIERGHDITVATKGIGNESRKTEDLIMFRRIWPSPLAELLASVYKASYKQH